jgi:multidrug efflux pump subunit AcrA (membrane-fusion protein)
MLPDMSAKVSFLARKLAPEEMKPRLAASRSALIDLNGSTFAYLLEGNRVRETPVRVGAIFGDLVELLSGLKAGDRVVVTP